MPIAVHRANHRAGIAWTIRAIVRRRSDAGSSARCGSIKLYCRRPKTFAAVPDAIAAVRQNAPPSSLHVAGNIRMVHLGLDPDGLIGPAARAPGGIGEVRPRIGEQRHIERIAPGFDVLDIEPAVHGWRIVAIGRVAVVILPVGVYRQARVEQCRAWRGRGQVGACPDAFAPTRTTAPAGRLCPIRRHGQSAWRSACENPPPGAPTPAAWNGSVAAVSS